jgi:beta-glucanase (GH16 family)
MIATRRSRRIVFILAVLVVLGGLVVYVRQQIRAMPATRPGWELTWSDEFDGPNGSPPDPSRWTHEQGGSGWGNNERQFYTARPENAQIVDGALRITAIKEQLPLAYCWYGDCEYTSARLITRGLFEQQYGRFEARIKIPAGQGLWPAFWLLGANIEEVGWPASGELDILENVGKEPYTIHGTAHGPGYSGCCSPLQTAYSLPGGQRFADDFHVYALEWEPAELRWYVDDVLYQTRTPADLPPGTRWVYDHPFFILLNLAVGGVWPGEPDATTVFPQSMLVDYVRVYRRIAGS